MGAGATYLCNCPRVLVVSCQIIHFERQVAILGNLDHSGAGHKAHTQDLALVNGHAIEVTERSAQYWHRRCPLLRNDLFRHVHGHFALVGLPTIVVHGIRCRMVFSQHESSDDAMDTVCTNHCIGSHSRAVCKRDDDAFFIFFLLDLRKSLPEMHQVGGYKRVKSFQQITPSNSLSAFRFAQFCNYCTLMRASCHDHPSSHERVFFLGHGKGFGKINRSDRRVNQIHSTDGVKMQS